MGLFNSHFILREDAVILWVFTYLWHGKLENRKWKLEIKESGG